MSREERVTLVIELTNAEWTIEDEEIGEVPRLMVGSLSEVLHMLGV